MKSLGKYLTVRLIKNNYDGAIKLIEHHQKETQEGIIEVLGSRYLNNKREPIELHVKKNDKVGFDPRRLILLDHDSEYAMIDYFDILYKYESQ